MAREWSLQETKVLVEEHIALKEEEKLDSRTASEHWNKIAKRLQDKGFYRSYKSCNKRWYRLEQYEVQIFSFNMEEGKNKNYWDLTRAERLEYRNKWPQLPLGDGIDKEMFDLLKKFSHQYEKKDKLESMNTSTTCIDIKEVIHTKPNIEINRANTQATPLPQHVVPSPHLTPRILSYTTIPNGEEQLKQQDESIQSQKKPKSNWPTISEQPSEQLPLSCEGALDGFKLQARELRKRRATEFRKNNRTVPYNSTQTTFIKDMQPLPSQNLPLITETTTFGSITVIPPPEDAMQQFGNNPMQNHPKYNVTETKPPIQFKRLFNSSPKMDTNENKNKNNDNNNNNNSLLNHQQPIGSHLNFQSQISKPTSLPLNQGKQLLHSINSHLPLIQPEDNHFSHNKNGVSSDVYHHALMNSNNFPHDLLHMGSLEEQLQVILGVNPNPLQITQNCEQLHKNTDEPHFSGINNQPLEGEGLATANLLGVAIGGLGVQLEAIVKLLQAKHIAEQEFRGKMLQLVENMVMSLHTIGQGNT